MSREEAVEILSDMRAEYNIFGDEEESTRYHVLSWAIKEMKVAQQWIPVTERLPEEEKDVLVTVFFHGLTTKHKTGWIDHIKPKRYVEVSSYFDGNWYGYSDDYKIAKDRHEVLAWMPLPEPWEGER